MTAPDSSAHADRVAEHDWKAECLRWRDEAGAGNFDALVAERDALQARLDAIPDILIPDLASLLVALNDQLGGRATLTMADLSNAISTYGRIADLPPKRADWRETDV